MKQIYTISAGLIISGLLLIPTALAQGVTGISLKVAPNALGIEWQAPAGGNVASYKVYFSKKSILQNNGKFDGTEQTIGNETNLVLLDLQNRGFSQGDSIFVAVTAIDSKGEEQRIFAEEQSIALQIAGAAAAPSAAHASESVGVENAISEELTKIRVRFSGPVHITEDAMNSFMITEEASGIPVTILSAMPGGNTVVLTTEAMTPRNRYNLIVADSVTAEDGSELDSLRKAALFVARGDPQMLEPPATNSIPPPAPTPTVSVDITPPEDAAGLQLTKSLQDDGKYTVRVSWEASLNTAKDLSSYNLYESANRGKSFVGPTALRATITSTTIANVPPGTLTVKLSAMDRSGNESGGIEEMIVLPETGPALLLLLSGIGAGVITLRRKRI